MAGIINTLKSLVDRHQNQVRNRKFVEAVMASMALLALADGEISFAELMARDYFLDHVQQLQIIEPNEAAELFRYYADTIKDDIKVGQDKVWNLVSTFCGDDILAPLLLNICKAIAEADTNYSEQEHTIIIKLTKILGLKNY
ncbi:TerB family tellurite resistance protein [Cyanobacterium sp. uoEpiScrs1]|uniref:TerB family tellurite resistance protein n=1 Tax=Cyanobacterium sp. uoEpiScrs1 TaxID=2976343 RepID=UPI00226AA530|nr:TerB family tellurite resistance protein [Cyanobacterium sp. uoEpiScrs1]